MFSHGTQMVYDSSPRHMVRVAFSISSYFLKAYVEFKVGMKGDSILSLHVLRTQSSDP